MAKKYDLIIIGAGPGGYTSAFKAAAFGMKVAVIEKEKIGGVCLNKGCIPTKALLYASDVFAMLQKCDDIGVSTDFISFDFPKMQKYKKRVVGDYKKFLQDQFDTLGIDVIKGTATLRRNRTVEVNSAEGKDYYEADYVILATGAKPIHPDIPGINLPGVVTSGRLLAAANWNFDRLTIVGGGVIGVEFATIFNALCAKVTIVERDDHLLGPMDHEVSEHLERTLREKGINVYCNANLQKITSEDGLTCYVEHEGETLRIKSSQVLTAVGRTPNIENLLGDDVHLDMEHGRISVNDDFMTSEKNVYAIGDMIAHTQLAHVAAAQGTFVVEKISGRAPSIKLEVVPNGMFVSLPIVPNCIYTQPEIATVGISEETAKKMNMKVRCGRYSMGKNGKSIITKEEDGFIRLIFEAYSNTIVGAQMVCARATDMIGEMATAIANGLTSDQLMLAMRAHPTYSEGITVAIEDAMASKIL